MAPTPFPTPPHTIPLEPLTSKSFSRFGTVVENPLISLSSSPASVDSRQFDPSTPLPSNATRANQGTALKFSNVSPLIQTYATEAPNQVDGKPAMSMFVCAPRRLIKASGSRPPSGGSLGSLSSIYDGEKMGYSALMTANSNPNSSQSSSSTTTSKSAKASEDEKVKVEQHSFSTELGGTDPIPTTNTPTPETSQSSSKMSEKEAEAETETRFLPIPILERHPYTTQTFIPMGLDADDDGTCYIVVVAESDLSSSSSSSASSSLASDVSQSSVATSTSADVPSDSTSDPTLQDFRAASWREEFSSSSTSSSSSSSNSNSRPETETETETELKSPQLEIRNPPLISSTRAFLCRGNQAVTYGKGTWHAPMVVLGMRAIDFVVVQWVSGAGDAREDCEEVEIVGLGINGYGVVQEKAQRNAEVDLRGVGAGAGASANTGVSDGNKQSGVNAGLSVRIQVPAVDDLRRTAGSEAGEEDQGKEMGHKAVEKEKDLRSKI